MSPIAVPTGATLVIGSLDRGAEYQALIAQLELDQAAARLDRFLVDRIVDGGASLPPPWLLRLRLLPRSHSREHELTSRPAPIATTLPPKEYAAAHVVLPEAQLSPLHPTLLSQLAASLAPSSPVHFHLPSAALPANLSSSLLLAGLQPAAAPASPAANPSVLSFTSPAAAAAAVPTDGVRLLRRPKSKAAKSAIWALQADSPGTSGGSGTITPSSLLTEGDLKRPVCVLPGEGERATKRKVRPSPPFLSLSGFYAGRRG